MTHELPILWMPGFVPLPWEAFRIFVRGRARVSAIEAARRETQGRLVVAPGGHAPRKLDDFPPFLCMAHSTDDGLTGSARVKVNAITRGPRLVVQELYDTDVDVPQEELLPIHRAWTQLEELRADRLPYADDVLGLAPWAQRLAWIAASVLPLRAEERLRLLVHDDPLLRLRHVRQLLQAEIDVALVERQILTPPQG